MRFWAFICFANLQLPKTLDFAAFLAFCVSCPGFWTDLPQPVLAKPVFMCFAFDSEQMLVFLWEPSQTWSYEPSGRGWLHEKPGWTFRVFKNAELSSLLNMTVDLQTKCQNLKFSTVQPSLVHINIGPISPRRCWIRIFSLIVTLYTSQFRKFLQFGFFLLIGISLFR